MNPIPCSVCGEGDHRAMRCPTLSAPLKSGFYAPPAGARQGGDDDDDERLQNQKPVYPVLNTRYRKRSFKKLRS